jgi:hypothetical protein
MSRERECLASVPAGYIDWVGGSGFNLFDQSRKWRLRAAVSRGITRFATPASPPYQLLGASRSAAPKTPLSAFVHSVA